ncbi:MAG TPA: hypothetical protein VHU79_09430 [Sphingomicrobium sp.]|jgi:hypothetical protein|nr:hypothetical protein [Sphingomicrobium sp.]
MILMALAAAALQWTGPRTEQYSGPGYFCGGGYRVQLGSGERALVLPQSQTAGVQSVRLVLSHGEINVWSGARAEPGHIVLRYRDTAVTEHNGGGAVSYIISNTTPYGLRLTSDSFRGFKQDKWFFSHANFSSGAENAVPCLSAYSY